jgi:hypothetical protein
MRDFNIIILLWNEEKKMAKYGRGLNREVVAAVNAGLITEPFSTKDIRKLIQIKEMETGAN